MYFHVFNNICTSHVMFYIFRLGAVADFQLVLNSKNVQDDVMVVGKYCKEIIIGELINLLNCDIFKTAKYNSDQHFLFYRS